MIPQPPPGQGPIDPRGALGLPPSPGGAPPGPEQPVYQPSASAPQPTPGAGAPQAGSQQQPQSQQQQQQGAGLPSAQQWGWTQPGYSPKVRSSGPYYPGQFPPPPRRGGFFRRLVLLLGILLLGGSILTNILLIGPSLGTTKYVITTTLNPGNSKEQIAVIPLDGLIDDAQEARFDRFMKHATDDADVKAVIILIDTPGGTVTASDEIYKRIKKFKVEKSVPVVVAMRGYATSGGYYAACGADYIVAERTTLTGNIGVLMPQYNIHKLMDKYGIEDNTVVATGATYKDAGSPTRAPNPDHAAYFQSEIDAAFTIFKKVVTDARAGKLTKPIAEIANGKAYNGEEAKELGLIDEVDDSGYLDAAVRYAAKQANLSAPEVDEYHDPPPSLMNLLTSSYGANRANAGGVTINLDASLLDRMSSPRMMFIYHAAPGGDVVAPAMK